MKEAPGRIAVVSPLIQSHIAKENIVLYNALCSFVFVGT